MVSLSQPVKHRDDECLDSYETSRVQDVFRGLERRTCCWTFVSCRRCGRLMVCDCESDGQRPQPALVDAEVLRQRTLDQDITIAGKQVGRGVGARQGWASPRPCWWGGCQAAQGEVQSAAAPAPQHHWERDKACEPLVASSSWVAPRMLIYLQAAPAYLCLT